MARNENTWDLWERKAELGPDDSASNVGEGKTKAVKPEMQVVRNVGQVVEDDEIWPDDSASNVGSKIDQRLHRSAVRPARIVNHSKGGFDFSLRAWAWGISELTITLQKVEFEWYRTGLFASPNDKRKKRSRGMV